MIAAGSRADGVLRDIRCHRFRHGRARSPRCRVLLTYPGAHERSSPVCVCSSADHSSTVNSSSRRVGAAHSHHVGHAGANPHTVEGHVTQEAEVGCIMGTVRGGYRWGQGGLDGRVAELAEGICAHLREALPRPPSGLRAPGGRLEYLRRSLARALCKANLYHQEASGGAVLRRSPARYPTSTGTTTSLPFFSMHP